MGRRPHPRLATWKRLWKKDRRIALALCDALVADRPVPPRLLARLGVIGRKEYHHATKELNPRKTVRFDDGTKARFDDD